MALHGLGHDPPQIGFPQEGVVKPGGKINFPRLKIYGDALALDHDPIVFAPDPFRGGTPVRVAKPWKLHGQILQHAVPAGVGFYGNHSS